MDYYFGYIQAIDDFGFLDEIDARVDINTMVKITEEERNQLLTDNGQGKDIILYNGEVFTAEPLQYIRQNNEYVPNPNYEAEKQAQEKQAQIAVLKEQIDIIDNKRIRAVCEPSIKDETTGETWLDYYNKQIQDLREQIKNLGG